MEFTPSFLFTLVYKKSTLFSILKLKFNSCLSLFLNQEDMTHSEMDGGTSSRTKTTQPTKAGSEANASTPLVFGGGGGGQPQ